MKILNLFAGIGGNRTLWTNCEVTAIEIDPIIANIYRKRFKDDHVIESDAYEYVTKHLDEFDVIWASPPCQSHTRLNVMAYSNDKVPKMPDFRLYALITYLHRWFKGKYIVENVNPYYDSIDYKFFKPKPINIGRHLFWSNCLLRENKKFDPSFDITKLSMNELCKYHHIEKLLVSNIKDQLMRRQVLRNCVFYEVGEYVLNQLTKPIHKVLSRYS